MSDLHRFKQRPQNVVPDNAFILLSWQILIKYLHVNCHQQIIIADATRPEDVPEFLWHWHALTLRRKTGITGIDPRETPNLVSSSPQIWPLSPLHYQVVKFVLNNRTGVRWNLIWLYLLSHFEVVINSCMNRVFHKQNCLYRYYSTYKDICLFWYVELYQWR